MRLDKERKQSILIVHNYYQVPGGEDTVVANEKRMLEDHGHKVLMYTRNNDELKSMNKIYKLMLPITTIFNFRTYFEIKSIIKKEKIDVVHVHNTLNLVSASVYYAAQSCRIPVVQTIHNFRFLCPGATFYRDGHICEECLEKGLQCAIKYSCYRNSRVQTIACVLATSFHRLTGIYGKINYICLTDFNKGKLLQLNKINEKNVYVKPNFVDLLGEFTPENQRDNFFVFAGRLDQLKGVDLLLKAWNKMGEKAPKLLICGKGPLEKWCKEYVLDNNLNVEMVGFVQNEEARRIIARSRGLILPTQWYEGFPMSIVEAFSVGTPVLCSDLGNSGSVIVEGLNGRKFKHNSIESIIAAVYSCDHMEKSTFDEYIKRYTSEENYKMLLNIYEAI